MDRTLDLRINGSAHRLTVEPRQLLSDILRNEVGLTGTKRGCDTAKCGACTVLLDGEPIKSCSLLALQADGCEVETVEGLREDGELSDLQQEFLKEFGFQCGYCTPGMLIMAHKLLKENPSPTESEIRSAISGNICRCTGYVNIVRAIKSAANDRTTVTQ